MSIPIAEMITWFDLIEDKVASAYFVPAEKDTFINQAQIDYVSSFFPQSNKRGLPLSAELVDKIGFDISPLKKDVTVSTDANGILLFSAIDTALGNGLKFWYTMNMASAPIGTCGFPVLSDYVKTKYVRDNDFWEFQGNSLKVATSEYPQFEITTNSFQLNPRVLSSVMMRVLRYPVKVVSTGSPVDSEMPYYTKTPIMRIALTMAGFSMRDIDWVVAQQQVDANIN